MDYEEGLQREKHTLWQLLTPLVYLLIKANYIYIYPKITCGYSRTAGVILFFGAKHMHFCYSDGVDANRSSLDQATAATPRKGTLECQKTRTTTCIP